MKVALLVDWEFPCDHRFLTNVYAENFLEKGHEITWLMRGGASQTHVGTTSWNGADVYLLPESLYSPPNALLNHINPTNDKTAIHRILEDVNPDIVHVRNDLGMGLHAASYCRNHDSKYAHQISHLKAESMREIASKENGIRRLVHSVKGHFGPYLRHYVAEQADAVLPISEAMKAHLQQSGYSSPMAVQTTGVDDSIDPDTIDPTPFIDQYNLYGSNLILYMGSMSAERNLEFLFKVQQKLSDDTTLVMMGGRDPDARERLQKQSERMGVNESVVFTGWVNDSTTISQAIRASSIGVSPVPPNLLPFRVSAPIKVLEYLIHETPVVATDIPDHRTVVQESGAGLIAEYSTDRFADAIMEVLSKDRAEMGEKGREYTSEQRSFDHLTKVTINIYKKILSDGL